MERKKAADFSPEVLELFDKYVHGGISRRQFLDRAAKFTAAGVTAATILDSLSPDYALAQQVAADDSRLRTEYVEYASPQGAGTMRAYMAWPSNAGGKLPGVLVIHENRGLNPYIEDVARRLGVANFLALAPDALTPLGGYPGSDDEGRQMQGQRDRDEMIEDFVAGARFLQSHPECTGKIGAVGFCYGGGVVNTLAVRLPDLGAGVPFYGNQPSAEDAARIKAPLMLQYAELDTRITSGWPAYEEALKAAGVAYQAYVYEGVNHGFHNDTTPRYDQAAAELAWSRTIEFFNENLR